MSEVLEAYEGFAGVYEELMDDIPYEQWKDRLEMLLKNHGIDEGLVLDLGCGTGAMTRLLGASGYDMIGVDASEEMLAVAREQSDSDILYLCQDMRDFELYGTVRAVVSVCDCMNYILEKEELTKVFRLVNNYLEADGLFLFDMNMEVKFLEIDTACIAENRENVSFIWNNCYDSEEKINEYELTLFLRNPDGMYEKKTEYHYEKAYSVEEVKEALKEAGMEFLAAYHDYTTENYQEGSTRVLFVAKEAYQEGKTYCNDDRLHDSGNGGR